MACLWGLFDIVFGKQVQGLSQHSNTEHAPENKEAPAHSVTGALRGMAVCTGRVPREEKGAVMGGGQPSHHLVAQEPQLGHRKCHLGGVKETRGMSRQVISL